MTNVVALKEIADVRDGTHDTPKKLRYGVKLVTSRQLKNNQILPTDYFISEEDADKVNQRSKVDKWDILITMIGTVGDLHLVRQDPDFVIKNIGLIKTNGDEQLARYLFYYLQSFEGRSAIKSRMSGTSQQFISLTGLRQLPIALPQREQLKQIGAKLSTYDNLIENNSKRIEKLEAMARLLYTQSIVGDSTEVELSEITDLISRGISPKYDEDGGSLVINQRCIREQKIDLTAARRQSKLIPSTKLILSGDVLINSTGVGTLGRVAQVYGTYTNTSVDSHVSIIRPNEHVNPYFFGAALMAKQTDFERLGTGATGQTELGRGAIARVSILLPPRDIQDSVGANIESIRKLIRNFQLKNLNLAATRDLLLPRLMSGEVEV